jgi:hypothetical protein
MLNLAFRNVVRQKLRAAMILGAVTFGVAALIVIGAPATSRLLNPDTSAQVRARRKNTCCRTCRS